MAPELPPVPREEETPTSAQPRAVWARRGKGFSAEGSKAALTEERRDKGRAEQRPATGHGLFSQQVLSQETSIAPSLGTPTYGAATAASASHAQIPLPRDVARILQHVQSLLPSLSTHGQRAGASPARGGSTERLLPTSTTATRVPEAPTTAVEGEGGQVTPGRCSKP